MVSKCRCIECTRRGHNDLSAGRRNPQNSEPPLIGTVLAEAKPPINSSKPRRARQHFVGNAWRPLLRQGSDEHDRVIGEACHPRRIILAVTTAIAIRERTKTRGVGRRIPAAREQRIGKDCRENFCRFGRNGAAETVRVRAAALPTCSCGKDLAWCCAHVG